MISKKLFALFVLAWALGFFVLVYLYFFVYYTATLVIISNEPDFRGELVSVRNAQNIDFTCPERECIIRDIPPFDYRLTLYKDDFKTQNISIEIEPRISQQIEVEFIRDPRLTLASVVQDEEFIRQDEWLDEGIYLIFTSRDIEVFFRELTGRSGLEMIYRSNLGEVRLREVPRISGSQISVQHIRESNDIYLQVWDQSFIYERSASNLIVLPFEIPVRYIKTGNTRGNFHVVTEVWSFTYRKQTNTTEFQYLFYDSVTINPENIVGIILPWDTERRQNFNLDDESRTLIVHYNSRTRERKVLLATSQDFAEIHTRGNDILLTNTQWETYRLENF